VHRPAHLDALGDRRRVFLEMRKRLPREVNAPPPDAAERPTLKTLAFMTGLGVTTVSRALKDAPEIGAETRRRVQLVAKQIGYRPNRAGVRLRTGKTNVISLVLNTEEQVGGFVSDIIYGISEFLAGTPYHLIVTPYARNNDPLESVRYVVDTGSADGIIISRTQPNDPRVRYMTEHGMPFATHGRTSMGIEHAYHDFDNSAFALAAVRKLAQLGRRRIALLAPPSVLSYHHHTREGFLTGLAEANMSEVPLSSITVDHSINDIRQHARQIMSRPNRPDGFVSSSGGPTFALVAGLEDAGLKLGRDVDIVSKQSIKLLHLFRPELYAVNEDFRFAGFELARAVTGAIARADVSTLQSLKAPPPIEASAQLAEAAAAS
jgi:LacI family transcriptional regulator